MSKILLFQKLSNILYDLKKKFINLKKKELSTTRKTFYTYFDKMVTVSNFFKTYENIKIYHSCMIFKKWDGLTKLKNFFIKKKKKNYFS